jgi:dipeptidyl-peptidase-3
MPQPPSSYAPPPDTKVHQLEIKTVFDTLNKREKLYAHYLARAAWCGSRVIMRQVSPESPDIFDFIISLYRACDGRWNTLVVQCGVTPEELGTFLEYCATFLCNLGNFYVRYNYRFDWLN